MIRQGTWTVATVLSLLVAACATEAPEPISEAPLAPGADAAKAAFVERIADPDVTYRVTRDVVIGPAEHIEDTGASVLAHYDVAGDDYAGQVRIRGHVIDAIASPDVHVYVRDGTTWVWTGNVIPGQEWLEGPTPESAQRPNAIASLQAEDLVFTGLTPDGLFEFAVVPWIGGDPIREWAALGILGGSEPAPMSIVSHDTRLTIDAEGQPLRLTSSWSFTSGDDGSVVEGNALVDEYAAMGLYVSIPAPGDGSVPMETSHDVDVGVGPADPDGSDNVISEPWFEIRASDDAAELEIVYVWPDRPILLGIEGAIGFVRAQDEAGDPVLDVKVPLEGGTISVPPGPQTIVVYYRTCDGNCAYLDAAHDWCAVEATIEPAARYTLTVEIVGEHRAVPALCEIGPSS